MTRAPWARSMLFALIVVGLAGVWANTRTFILRRNGPKPVVLSGYYLYHGMAQGLREGRVGQLDVTAMQRYQALNDPYAPYPRVPPAERKWVSYYTLDVGYLFIVEAARLAFPSLPDNVYRSLALQLIADAFLTALVYGFFAMWSHTTGIVAALLYAVNSVFCVLVSITYYYYWDVPLAFAVFACLVAAYRLPDRARTLLVACGFLLGFGVWLRGTWWPIALFLFVLAAATRRLRGSVLAAVIAFGIVAAPQVLRSSVARGHLALSTRATWHVALVGLGYYPNPYGFGATDETIFALTARKYGVQLNGEDYYEHDQAAKREYFEVLRRDPWFVIRSFWGRLKDSVANTTPTSMPAYLVLTNIQYRLLCLAGLVLMLMRGGEMRLLGAAAAGTFAIYVLATCLFYFVGLVYDNVTEVALFVMFVGGIDTLLQAARGFVAERA